MWCVDDADSLKSMLDRIDQVRTTLSGLKGGHDEQRFYEEILSSLPQFVACGPQSSGKSSVIRRISGVTLPEAATLCTRIATLVQMRREKDPAINVVLVGPSGQELSNEPLSEPDRVHVAVEKAQMKALESSSGKQFVDDHTVTIRVCGPDQPNVTLVDLPGFHNDNDEGAKIVNEMVKRYVEMAGTLTLHVIRGDQDYASVLGNDFMRQVRKDDSSRVTVLTHCDKFQDMSVESSMLLENTLSATAKNSSGTFAVHGRASGKEEAAEEAKMRQMLENDSRMKGCGLRVGVAPLAKHLEDRMRSHLEMQYPKAVKALRASLADTIAKIDKIRERTPSEVLLQMAFTMEQTFDREKRTLMNQVREMLHTMAMDIKNYEISPINKTANNSLCKRDDFSEPLEVGQKIYVQMENERFAAIVTSATKEKVSWREKAAAAEGAEPRTGTTAHKEIWTAEVTSPQCIVEDIRLLIQSRGTRNIMHADRQPIIESYAADFAKHYDSKIRSSRDLIDTKLAALFDTVFLSKDIPESGKRAGEHLRECMEEELETNRQVSDLAIESIAAHNTEPDLIFSSNDHYLSDLVQKMVAADTDMASDNGSFRHIYHNVRAFIKVQRKYITEIASKELLRTTVLAAENSFRNLLKDKVNECTNRIQEPNKVTREREMLLSRKEILEQAIECFNKPLHAISDAE